MKTTKLVLFVIFIMLMAMSTSLMAQTTIYVNYSTGNDATGDGSSGSPYKTFTKGYTEAVNGDILDLTGTFTWANADESPGLNGFNIEKDITIQGQGADQTIIQADSASEDDNGRIFCMYSTSHPTVTIKDLTLRNGSAYDEEDFNGGAIDISGSSTSVTIKNCYIHSNKTSEEYGEEYVAGYGGAISVINATLTIENSTIASNTCYGDDEGSGGGGAIFVDGSSSTIEITNSTICDNESLYDVGGGGLLIWDGNTTITNSTIFSNYSDAYGCGILIDGGTLTIKNTILAGNDDDDDYSYSNGTLTDNGNNIVENSDVAANETGGFNNATTILYNTKYNTSSTSETSWTKGGSAVTGSLNLSSTLADNNTLNGTKTLALSSGSFAIDAGNASGAPTTDQRGAGRNGATDIGAYEWWNDDAGLPVTLSSFTASLYNTSPQLLWTTQSEQENLGWNVYRSSSFNFGQGILLTSDLIEGAGTVSHPTDYTFNDPLNIEGGRIYCYWLESFSYSGESELFGPVTLTVPYGIENHGTPLVPRIYGLYQNYPNPFNPTSEISFALEEAGNCELVIYNVKGRMIKKLFTGNIEAERVYSFIWDGKDESGKTVSSGIYYYKMKAGNYQQTKKMILLK